MYTACSNGVVAFARVSKCTPAAAVGHSPYRGFASLQSRVSRHIAVVTSGRYKSQLIVHAEASGDIVDVEPISVAVKDVQPPKKKVKGKTVVITGGSQVLLHVIAYGICCSDCMGYCTSGLKYHEVHIRLRLTAILGSAGSRETNGAAVRKKRIQRRCGCEVNSTRSF
jgi:hypothetical protein